MIVVSQSYDHLAYGLRVRADRAIPGLFTCPTEPADRADILVRFDAAAAEAVVAQATWSPHPTLVDSRLEDAYTARVDTRQSADGTWTMLEYCDGARFIVRSDGGALFVLPPPGMEHESVCTYLVNPVLALCLRFRGSTCLHASSVVIDDRAVLFVAPSGSGKSSLAYAFGRHGHRILTDDVAALQPGPEPVVHPGNPRLRLWPWTVDDLLGDVDALPRISGDWEKRRFDVPHFDPTPAAIAGIVVLKDFSPETILREAGTPVGLLALLSNVYLDHLMDVATRRRDFAMLARLVEQVPVAHLHRRSGLEHVDESVDAVIAWTRTFAAL
ncbi:hypothetical protein BH23GEM6_BH23GEM6_20120 [soil metagenome]